MPPKKPHDQAAANKATTKRGRDRHAKVKAKKNEQPATLNQPTTTTATRDQPPLTTPQPLPQLQPQATTSLAPPAPTNAIANNQFNEPNDYHLLLTPLFAAMTKITDHLFLTGVGGMTRENFRKNHIDFVVNITTEAPFWEDIESMRLPLEDDINTNILPYLDIAVDRINEAIVKRNAHVLVHCVAGVSRSATIVIAYLMKFKRMDLKTAFNFCYNLRPVIRPNNGFMLQLINYELQLFNKHSVYMIDVDVDGLLINVPHFFVEEHPRLVLLEVMRVKEQLKEQQREEQQKVPKNKKTVSTISNVEEKPPSTDQ